jgi:hypothetical protein
MSARLSFWSSGPELEPFDARIPVELGKQAADRAVGVGFVGANEQDEQDSRGPCVAQQERQQFDGPVVGPLQVVDDDQAGSLPGTPCSRNASTASNSRAWP